MKIKLSRLEEISLKFIRSYVVRNGYMPTRKEIAVHLAYGDSWGKQGAQQVVKSLERKGYLKRGKGWRNLTLLTNK